MISLLKQRLMVLSYFENSRYSLGSKAERQPQGRYYNTISQF
jgi:hypothetical protein